MKADIFIQIENQQLVIKTLTKFKTFEMKCTLNEEFDENCYDNRNVKVRF